MVSILIMLFDAHNGYIKGHDTDFHVSNISAIVDQLSWDNVTVQEPLKYMANDFGYGTRFFYPPIPHLLAAYIVKYLRDDAKTKKEELPNPSRVIKH